VARVRETWTALGIESHALGRFDAAAAANTIRRDGRELALAEPGEDPFWRLFFAGLRTE
jgi:hypothetical protein